MIYLAFKMQEMTMKDMIVENRRVFMAQIHDIFERIDTDGSGAINASEMRKGLKEFGFNPSIEQTESFKNDP